MNTPHGSRENLHSQSKISKAHKQILRLLDQESIFTLQENKLQLKSRLQEYQQVIKKEEASVKYHYSMESFFQHAIQARYQFDTVLDELLKENPILNHHHNRLIQTIPPLYQNRFIEAYLAHLIFLRCNSGPKHQISELRSCILHPDTKEHQEELKTYHRFDLSGIQFKKISHDELIGHFKDIKYPDYLSIEWGIDNIQDWQISVIKEYFHDTIGLHLGYSSNAYHPIERLGNFVKHFPNVKSLAFTTRSYLDRENSEWHKLFRSIYMLQELAIRGDQILYESSPATIKQIFGEVSHLKYLTYDGGLTPHSSEKLSAVFSSLGELKGLNLLESIDGLNPDQLVAIFDSLTSLSYLGILARPETVHTLQTLCPHLPKPFLWI